MKNFIFFELGRHWVRHWRGIFHSNINSAVHRIDNNSDSPINAKEKTFGTKHESTSLLNINVPEIVNFQIKILVSKSNEMNKLSNQLTLTNIVGFFVRDQKLIERDLKIIQ